jgi:hypothetical protein
LLLQQKAPPNNHSRRIISKGNRQIIDFFQREPWW